MHADFDFLPPVKHSSASGSDSERSPPRSHGGAGLSRKNRPQRCSICKETGHKSRTCRFAQGKGTPLAPPLPLAIMHIDHRASTPPHRLAHEPRALAPRSGPATGLAARLLGHRPADLLLLDEGCTRGARPVADAGEHGSHSPCAHADARRGGGMRRGRGWGRVDG